MSWLECLEQRSGFLRRAAHDETVNSFGRNDGSLVGGRERATTTADRALRDDPLMQKSRMNGHPAGSEFEVYLHGVDERQEPGEELLVDGMSVVGIVSGAVGELHDTAELIALAAGRGVEA